MKIASMMLACLLALGALTSGEATSHAGQGRRGKGPGAASRQHVKREGQKQFGQARNAVRRPPLVRRRRPARTMSATEFAGYAGKDPKKLLGIARGGIRITEVKAYPGGGVTALVAALMEMRAQSGARLNLSILSDDQVIVVVRRLRAARASSGEPAAGSVPEAEVEVEVDVEPEAASGEITGEAQPAGESAGETEPTGEGSGE
jgi:hypothetical protein